MINIHFSLLCRLIALLLLSLFPTNMFSQEITYCYKGSWSSWTSAPGNIYKYNDGSGFLLKTAGQVVFFSFEINNYNAPTKKEIKEHLRSNTWFEYSGVVEYYVNDSYPTSEDIAKHCHLVYPDPRHDITPNVLRTCKATIKVAPYKKEPECYNIFFDGIGIGISVRGLKFSHGK